MLSNNITVVEKGNKNVKDLTEELKKDIVKYNLIGLSIIFPVNESYKFQEANKDIDYITMSIPFIGNTRPPTLEKIKQGLGVLNTDSDNIIKLLNNEEGLYDQIVLTAQQDGKEYSEECFENRLLKVYSLLT